MQGRKCLLLREKKVTRGEAITPPPSGGMKVILMKEQLVKVTRGGGIKRGQKYVPRLDGAGGKPNTLARIYEGSSINVRGNSRTKFRREGGLFQSNQKTKGRPCQKRLGSWEKILCKRKMRLAANKKPVAEKGVLKGKVLGSLLTA